MPPGSMAVRLAADLHRESKNKTLNSCPWLQQMLTDFQNSLTDSLANLQQTLIEMILCVIRVCVLAKCIKRSWKISVKELSQTVRYFFLFFSWAMSVSLSQVRVLSKRTNESSWILAWELPSTYDTLCYKIIRLCTKIRVLPSGTLLQTLDLKNFARAYRSSKRAVN